MLAMMGNALLLALRELRRNVMRSILTMLGIIIGVAAVIILVTLGSGATRRVTEQIASLGSNLLMISPGKRMGPGQSSGAAPFKLADPRPLRGMCRRWRRWLRCRAGPPLRFTPTRTGPRR